MNFIVRNIETGKRYRATIREIDGEPVITFRWTGEPVDMEEYEPVGTMNAQQALRRVDRAVLILAWGWILNNVLGAVSIVLLPYLVWWRWGFGILPGIAICLVGFRAINGYILPAIFLCLNHPFALMAKSGAVKLVTLKVLEPDVIFELNQAKVHNWPAIIRARWKKDGGFMQDVNELRKV